MKLDVLAERPHFADHVAAVLLALRAETRGRAIAWSDDAASREATADRFRELGLEPTTAPDGADPILVASIGDLKRARRNGRRHVALMEHGAGQSYGGVPGTIVARHPAYAGGTERAADLFLHPGSHPAARDRAAYPDARVELVGSPFVDALPAHEPQPDAPVVAIASHFDATACPESQSGFNWLAPGVFALARRYKVLGHGHPRIIDRLAPWYEKRGIEVVRSFRDVARRADVLVFDNTSAGFAFAATGRPVVVVNPPTYRRDVEHGLRFWQAATVGIQVDRSDDLPAAVDRALALLPDDVAAREAALDLVYAYRRGAAKRAAEVLTGWLGEIAAQVPAEAAA